MARLRAVSLLGVTLGLLTGCGSSGGNGGGGTTPPPPSTGSLTITVSELPSGASASITVSGPSGYSASVTSTETLQVAAGAYTVAAASVSAGKSNYYPAIASQSAIVAVSTTASVTVDYATIIPTTTKAIDAAGKSSLTVSSDASTITMSTSSAVAASLQANDILASGITTAAPNGLLVKIISVSTSGQTVTASVEPATLEEAIQQGTLQYRATLDTTNTTRSAYLPKASSRSRRLPGSRRLSRSLAQPEATTIGACANNPNTLNYPYPSVPLFETPNSTLTLLGESDFCPTISFVAKISAFGVLSANATASLGVHNAIGVEGTDHVEFDPVYNFPAITSVPIEVSIGPLVVVVQPTLTPFIGLDGSADASAYAGITTDSTVSVGLSYANGTWTPSGSASPTVVQPATAVDGQVSIKAYAGLKAGVLIYGTVTPYLSTDGYLQFQSGLNMTPCWSLTAGVEGSVGISGTALGKDFDYPTAPLNLYSASIAQSTGTCFAPTLSTIYPMTAIAGSGQLTLAVTGSNFVPDTTVNWNGQALVTTYVDTNDLTAVIPASDLATGGTFPVTVNSPDSPGGTSPPMNFTVSQVTVIVSPASASVATGQSQQFASAVTGTTNTAVNWSVNGIAGGNAVVGTISSNGLYTAPATIPSPASVAVSATSQDVPSVSGSARVTIISGVVITVSPSCNAIPSGTSLQFIASVQGTSNTAVNWAVNGVAGGSTMFGTISSTGLYTAPATIPSPSSVMVAASSQASETAAGSTTVQVISGSYRYECFVPGGVPTDALTFGGISGNAQIVGNGTDSTTSGFVYRNGTTTPIAYPGSSFSYVSGINNSGQIVGFYDVPNSSLQSGFLYTNGSYSSFSPAGGPTDNVTFTGINDSGQIVGNGTDSTTSGFVYQNGVTTPIAYPGSSFSYVSGINNSGQIVGFYDVPNSSLQSGFIATPVK
jgi:hypothetical protein